MRGVGLLGYRLKTSCFLHFFLSSIIGGINSVEKIFELYIYIKKLKKLYKEKVRRKK